MNNDNSLEKNNIEKLLKDGKTIQLKPHGYSMYPLLIPERDEVIIKPIPNHKIKRGDVILYRRPAGKLILHRVFKNKNDKLFMVGDNEHLLEGPVPLEYVYGYMSSFIRNGKRLSIKNPLYVLYWKLWLILINVREPIGKFIHKIKTGKK